MDVVEADIAGKPLEEARQFVERTAVQTGFGELPLILAFPVGRVEIVLDIKKPHTDGRSHQ